MKLTIISGRSGSGKSTAIQALEDQGYYCVDNLPVGMLPTLAQQLSEGETAIGHVAVGIDARNLPGQLLAFDNILDALKQQQITSEIIYLDADDNTLLLGSGGLIFAIFLFAVVGTVVINFGIRKK